MKKLSFVLLLSLFVTACDVTSPPRDTSLDTDQYTIGVIIPMTGGAAHYGLDVQKGLQVMADEINQSGGVHGKDLAFVWEDGKCNPKDASMAAQKLINVDKVKILMGMPCSGETLGVAPIAEKNEVILMTTLAKSPAVSQAGDFVFRFSTPASTHGKLVAQYLNNEQLIVGSMTEQTDFPLGVLEAFNKHLKMQHHEEFFLSTESDFKTRLTKLKNKGVEVLFINPQTYEKALIMLRQIQELQWYDVRLAVNESVANAGGEFQDSQQEMFSDRETVSAIFMIPDNPNVKAYLDLYQERYEKKPDYTEAYLMSLDGLQVMAQVLNDLEDPYDTKAIRDGLYGIKDYEGVQGRFSLDQNGDISITQSLVQFEGDTFIPLK